MGSVKGPELESQDLMGEPSITTDSVSDSLSDRVQ